MFWEVGETLCLRQIREERSEQDAAFYITIDEVFKEEAENAFELVFSAALLLLVAALWVIYWYGPEIEPFTAALFFYGALFFLFGPLSHAFAKPLSVPLIEIRWAAVLRRWFAVNKDSRGEKGPPDFEYLRALDPRLDVALLRYDHEARVDWPKWVGEDQGIYPPLREPKFFLRFWLRRPEIACLGMLLASLLAYLGYLVVSYLLGALVLVVSAAVFIWRSRSVSAERQSAVRFEQIVLPAVLNGNAAMVEFKAPGPRIVEQFAKALHSDDSTRLRFWTQRLLSELLEHVEKSLHRQLIRDVIAPRIEKWYGKALSSRAWEILTNFRKG